MMTDQFQNLKPLLKPMADLLETIKERKDADPQSSYVARLYAKGRKKIAQKVGEEGVELALAGVLDDKEDAIAESADLIFHMMVLWSDMGIEARDVMAEISRREGVSGIEEKNNR
jgi:phosphoribosyl-ATP pyrophosphohydrolase